MSKSVRYLSCLAVFSVLMARHGDVAAQPVANAPPVAPDFTTQRVAIGFSQPVYCGAPPHDVNRLFVVEQGGKIQIHKFATGARTLFLDIHTLIAAGGERGLLGLAFHPLYGINRRFYVYYNGAAAGETRVVEYLARQNNPDQADPASARLILTISRPQSNHNGGWLGFGPDGFLYISSGDGGNGNDTGPGHTNVIGNAQDITDNLLGKMLRIDVNRDSFPTDPNRNYGIPANNPFVGKTGDDEIWAYGLRNPWRCSFDRLTGDMYIADVGQGQREEINFQPRFAAGGRNYGWRLREGTIATPGAGIGGPAPAGAIEPIYDYGHGTGPLQGSAVTGGYVYRGPIPSLNGTYFFADFSNSRIWSVKGGQASASNFTDWTAALKPAVGAINRVSAFGEDGLGNLYLVDYDGELYKIVKRTAPAQTIVKDAIIRGLTQPPTRSKSGP